MRVPDGSVRIGQSKLSYTRNLYADQNINFWKTLSIWVDLITGDEIDPKLTEFYLISNFSVNRGFVADLKTTESVTNIRALTKKLKTLASKAGKESKECAAKILGCDDNIIDALLERIRVNDAVPSNPQKQIDQFAAVMNLTSDISDVVIRGMRGWFLEQCEMAFAENRAALIDKDKFSHELTRLIAQYFDKRLVLRTAAEIEVKPEAKDAAKGAIFVEQIQWVEGEDDEILEAIDDYLRSVDERTRLAGANNVSRQEFISFESRLIDRWKGIHRAAGDGGAESKHAGRKALRKSLEHREFLAGQQTTEYYLTRGYIP